MKRPESLKVGDKFVVKKANIAFNVGDIIALHTDDGTDCPWFSGSTKYPDGYWSIGFNALSPYDISAHFGGRIDGHTVNVHIGRATGTAKYNPDDEKRGLPFRPEVGVALAYARAAGMPESAVDKLADALIHSENKAPVPSDCPFKVGDLVTAKEPFEHYYSISAGNYKRLSKIPARIIRVEYRAGDEPWVVTLKDSSFIWPTSHLKLVLDPNRPFKVGDKVRFFTEEERRKKHFIMFGFPSEMKHLYNQRCTIKSIQGESVELNGVDTGRFSISTDMLVHNDTPDSPSKSAFVPHLEQSGKNVGTIGEDAGFTDIIGHQMHIGDTVDLYNAEGVKWGIETLIVKEDALISVYNLGCEETFKDGISTKYGWKIVKRRGYEKIQNGEVVDTVKYIKENPDA